MVAPSVALSLDHTGAPNVVKHGKELADSRPRADHPNFTVCNNIIRCVYRAELILGMCVSQIVYLSAHGHGSCQAALHWLIR